MRLKGIFMDGDPLKDAERAFWEQGVRSTLSTLYFDPIIRTGKIIIDAIGQTNKRVAIVPRPDWLKPLPQADIGGNAEATADDPDAAKSRDDPSTPGAPRIPGPGSDSHIQFHAHDFEAPTRAASLTVGDEILLHELIHSLRQMSGLAHPTALTAPLAFLNQGSGTAVEVMTGQTPTQANKHSQLYDDFEEFVAIVLTNVYRAESGRIGLRRDHHVMQPLNWPMTNPWTFEAVWSAPLRRLRREMSSIAEDIARIASAQFNPLRVLYMNEVWVPVDPARQN
jgi:hypothetical protein